MKYMHFNSSCSYAGLANILAMMEYDTEDYQIASDMSLPYLLNYEEELGCYQSGPMLQSAEWFNLYLEPRGFSYTEQWIEKNNLPDNLCPGMMLGIQVTPHSKHAVVFLEKKKDCFFFLNNKYQNSEEEELFSLSEEELLERLPNFIITGKIERCEAKKIDMIPLFQKSISNWERLRKEVQEFVSEVQTPQSMKISMNRLFRPLLLDGITMMQLLDKEKQVEKLQDLQKKYLAVVREERKVRLAEEFDCTAFDDVVDEFIGLIRQMLVRKNTVR